MKLDKRGRPRLTERQIEKQIVDALEAHGWRVLRTNQFAGAVIQRQGSVEPGIPDLMARKGWCELRGIERIEWIEVKRPGQSMNERQVHWWNQHLDESVRVARCVEDVEDLLK